jgi:hypothetical protein
MRRRRPRNSNYLRIRYDDGSLIRCPKCRSLNWWRRDWTGLKGRFVIECGDCGRHSCVAYADKAVAEDFRQVEEAFYNKMEQEVCHE